ncbi:hypothetical protein [Parasitella parasitica]|uniref:Probable lysosomal cobalamin transporter n=1 Tax=Parasitella parasitica TaxID=35722 RepID=A0A0B7NIN9_9FUNG|nr:hypothetical protein [Parasitella parasitica]
MSAAEGIAWTIYGIVAIFLFLFSLGFTRYFQNKYESEFFATCTTILALGLVFSTLTLLPVDIFLVSSTIDQAKGLKKGWATADAIETMKLTMSIVYYVCYGLITFFSFLLIPFAYFFYEEIDEEETISDRIGSAAKYTSFFVVISVLLFAFGLFLKPTTKAPKIDLDWFKKLLTDSHGEKAITFVVACLVLLGMLVFIAYTAPGLSLLPISLIKGRKHIDAEGQDVENRLTATRERQRVIQSKYVNRAMPAKDRREMEELQDQERILSRRLRGIEQDKTSVIQRLLFLLRPFEVISAWHSTARLHICAGSLDFSDDASICGKRTHCRVDAKISTSVDKIAFAICGSQCGYVIHHSYIFNPVNYIFINLQKVFPLDYVFMVGLILYFFMATMSGVIQIGVRFLWVTLFRIQKGSTAPQGLLVSAVLLTLSLLALNYTVTTTVAPGYAHFGSQVYCNFTDLLGNRNCTDHVEKIVPCDIYGPTGFVVALFRRPRNNVDADLQELVDEEEESLLRHSSVRHYQAASQ